MTSYRSHPKVPARQRGFLSLLRDQRGTASLEAAVMLPVMAICWAGLMLRFDQLERYMDAAVSARRDAWLFSFSGCEDDPPSATSELKVNCAGGNKEGWMTALSKIPVVSFFVQSLLGYKATAVGSRDYTEPPLLGGKKKTTRYSYSIMCNEKSRDGDDVLGGVLCQTIQKLGLGFGVGHCPMQPKHGDDSC